MTDAWIRTLDGDLVRGSAITAFVVESPNRHSDLRLHAVMTTVSGSADSCGADTHVLATAERADRPRLRQLAAQYVEQLAAADADDEAPAIIQLG